MKNKETGQKSPGTMMLYATNNSLVKRLIEDKEYNCDKNFETRNPKINKFGFIGELLNGFISDGTNKMEINFHEKTDLSLTQNRGFSLFFWFLAKKQPQGTMRYILKQGNSSQEITPSIGFLPNCANLFVKILSSKNRQETLYSSKTIEPNRLYSLTVTFSIDYDNDLTDILLYLDGLLDSQISIPGEPLHNQGKMHIGKVDKNTHGFIGFIADILIVPRVLNEVEISQISKACFINLINNVNDLNMCLLRSYEIFERKFERDKLLEKYAAHTGSPLSLLENLDLLNDELRDIVKKFDENLYGDENEENIYTYSQNLSENNNLNFVRFKERNISHEDHKVLQKLQQFLESDETEKSIFFRKVAVNANFIYSVFFLISEDQTYLNAKRIVNILQILKESLHMNIEEQDLISLAKILGSFENDNINIATFIRNDFYFTKILHPEINLKLCNNIKSNNNSSLFKTSAYFYNIPSSSAAFYMYNNNNNSQTGFNYYNQLEQVNSVELHENFLLRSSQQFANIKNSEEDFGKEFAKSTFSIKSLYSRPKTATRPTTTRGGFNANAMNNEREDYVNQCNYDEVDQEIKFNNNLNDKEKQEKENYENKENLLSTPKLQEADNLNNNNNFTNNLNNINSMIGNNESHSLQINSNANSNPSGNENAQTFNNANNINSANKELKTNSPNDNEKEKNSLNENYDNAFENFEDNMDISNSKIKKAMNEADYEGNQNLSITNNITNLNINTTNKKEFENQQQQDEIPKPIIENVNKNPEEEKINVENINKEKLDKIPEANDNDNKNEFSGFVSDLNAKIMGKNFEETRDQFSDPENLIHLKISQNQMIDHNVQVDGNKIEEEYKEEENMDMGKNEDQISIIELEAKYPDDWNMGAFELVINHCFDCHKHKRTTRHYEFTYVEKFNSIGDSIKEVFPNIQLLGNFDKIDHLGCFDIYIRGVGPHLDDKGRYHLYSKKLTKSFPNKTEIVDKLVTLAMLYGSSCNMEAAQSQYIKAYSSLLPKQSSNMHEHPASLSEDAEKEKNSLNAPPKQEEKIDPDRTKFSCMNFGCGATFVNSENHAKSCCFHPGIWQFGSYNAYWPEAWSCCEKSWEEEGCQRGSHKGVRLENRINLCLNFGALNPKTAHPDSACGVYYSKDQNQCKYHSGYFNQKNQSWTCCDIGEINAEGCVHGIHKTYFWPDEKAKLYFYPKILNNPGLNKPGKAANKSSKPSTGHQICKCDFFKPTKQYENSATKFELLKIKREKEKDELRICFRWACDKTFKESSNVDKSCLCHPGKWDHGCTGTKMTKFIGEFPLDPKNVDKKTILWRPHWTCCGGEWESKGCKLITHSGPLVEEAENYNRKYRWPDVRAKLYFSKVVSSKWKKNLEQYTYSEDKVKSICRKFFGESKRMVSDLPSLCDNLRLYLLVVNDNIDYQLKFMDIATQTNSIAFFSDDNGYVDPQKFVQWWFGGYEEIINSLVEKK